MVLSLSGSVEMRAPQVGWLSSAVIILFEIHSVVVGYDWNEGEKSGGKPAKEKTAKGRTYI